MARGLSEQAHQKVLDAATELFAANGIDATSMDAIAAAAAVSKATVYKHWADKNALCLEVLLHVHRRDEGPGEHDSGDWKTDLKAFLAHEPRGDTASMQRRLAPHLIAYSAKNQQFGGAWRAQVTERARASLLKFLQRGIEQGAFPAGLDQELSVALLWGPMMYQHIFGPSLDRARLAERVVEAFWKAHVQVGAQREVPVRGRKSRVRERRS
jgi:AcrR family transcriptional regulator